MHKKISSLESLAETISTMMQSNSHAPPSCLHFYPQHLPVMPVPDTRHQESFQEVMDQLKVTLSFPYAQTEVSSASLDDQSVLLDFIDQWNCTTPPNCDPVKSSACAYSNQTRDNRALPDPQKMMSYVNMIYGRYQHENDDLKDIIWRSDEATRKNVIANNVPLDLSIGGVSKDISASTIRPKNPKNSQLKVSRKKFQYRDQRSSSSKQVNEASNAYQRKRGPPNVTMSGSDFWTPFNSNPSTTSNQVMWPKMLRHDAYQQSFGCYNSSRVNDLPQQQISSAMMSFPPNASVNQADLLAHYSHWRQHYVPQLLVSQTSNQIPSDESWFHNVYVNLPAVRRRAATLGTRRSVKKQWQAAWLLRVVSCIDLTTLSGDDTFTNVQRLCFKAKQPIRQDLMAKMNLQDLGLTTGAVCVYPNRVSDCAKVFKSIDATHISIASVATGFPSGQVPLKTRLEEIRQAVADGASEIDIVINRQYALSGNWKGVYEEVRLMKEACGEAHLKTILATGELGNLGNVYRASMVCMMAGADFIKTSTGKESVNATFVVALVMVRAIREYYHKTNYKVGFKPAGGIRSAKDSCTWLSLMKEELGDDWTKPDLFRIGASGLLIDIERQIFHFVTSHYAATHELPMA